MGHRLDMFAVDDCLLEGNIRHLVVDEEIRLLADSLKKRQVHPIFVMDDGRVIDGGKRVRAARLAGLRELLAVITDEPLAPPEILELQVVSAFHRSDPSNFDKWRAMEAVKAARPGWTNRQIAEHLSIDPKMVKILLSPGQCAPEIQDALRDDRIGISVCHELSLLPPEEQLPLLDLKLAGVSRDEVARQARKRRQGSSAAERVKRSRFARPSGSVVTLSGDHTIGEAADELAALAAEMRRAEKNGTSIKTFAATCRDRAEAGV